MKFFKKLNTIYYRLIISYAILIIITVTIVGIGSYLYFSANFNEQVKAINQRVLNQFIRILDDNIIQKTESTYLNLLSSSSASNSEIVRLFNENIQGNHAAIGMVQQTLQSTVASRSSFLNAIDVYYTKSDMMISSRAGVTYVPERHGAWLESTLAASPKKMHIVSSISNNLSNPELYRNTLTLVIPYPITDDPVNQKGYMAFHINDTALLPIIQSEEYTDDSVTFLLHPDGTILYYSNRELYTKIIPDFDENILDSVTQSTELTQSFIAQQNDTELMVSFATQNSYGLKLVNVTPIHQFYEKSAALRNTLILICFIVIGIGILISNLFTMKIYNPIRLIVSSTKHLFDPTSEKQEKSINELSHINEVINNLSIKVNRLETTLNANMPLIKHNLVYGLFSRNLANDDELLDRLDLLGIRFDYPYYFSIRLNLNPFEMKNLDIENSQFVKYNTIEQLESYTNHDCMVLAIELSDHEIGVAMGTNSSDSYNASKMFRQLTSYIYANFMIHCTVAIGSRVKIPLDLYQSYQSASLLQKYEYFMPQTHIMHGDQLQSREQSTESISSVFLERFDQGLKYGDPEAVRATIRELIDVIKTGPYSAEQCHQRRRDMISVFHQYIKGIHYHSNDVIDPSLQEQLTQVRNIDQEGTWLIHIVEHTFRFLEQKNLGKNEELIQAIKKYIIEHIASPLSLDYIADKFALSSRYLSKLFKEVSGENFTDYITAVRIETAKDLILSTDLSVETISSRTGFNSSAYFIKVFKKAYGVTPKQFKHNFLMKDT